MSPITYDATYTTWLSRTKRHSCRGKRLKYNQSQQLIILEIRKIIPFEWMGKNSYFMSHRDFSDSEKKQDANSPIDFLVTGGTGAIGKVIAYELATNQDFEVLVCPNKYNGLIYKIKFRLLQTITSYIFRISRAPYRAYIESISFSGNTISKLTRIK